MKRAISHLVRLMAAATFSCFIGCGSSSSNILAAGPSISMQPANQSVPMGLSGTFSVVARGTSPQYQWSRDGSPIPGATASSYTTAPTAFSDTGSTFEVVVSNEAGSVTSRPASLTVTARGVKAGDLRFQQVDAASTIDGYSAFTAVTPSNVGCPPQGAGGVSVGFSPATGTGFFLTSEECNWQAAVFALPTGMKGLEVGYAGVALSDYPNVLGQPIGTNVPAPNDPGSVITSLSFDRTAQAAAVGWIHSDTSTSFLASTSTVPATSLQATATQEGLQGRVVTAVSYDGTEATYYSYGWTDDPSTVYESKVVFATLATTADQIQALAAEGYILTASGGTQAQGGTGVVLVGTRVQGDTTPRPVLVGDALAGTVDPLMQQGYAFVAIVTQQLDNVFIGER